MAGPFLISFVLILIKLASGERLKWEGPYPMEKTATTCFRINIKNISWPCVLDQK